MARIGGSFPFPTAQVSEGGGVICLASGQAFYPPPGEWLCSTGQTTAVQYWDPINQLWRTPVAPTIESQYFSTDGYNYRLVNLSGTVVGASITAASSGGTNGIGATATGTAVTFTAPSPATTGGTATAYAIVGGSVAAPTVTQGGSGFVEVPLIVIDPPPPGGIQATAVATINNSGAVTAITMVNVGAGYTASPNFWVIPQFAYYAGGASGSFAAAASAPAPGLVFPSNAVPGNQNTSSAGCQLTTVALTGSGTLTGIVVVDGGNGYSGTTIPTITIAGGGLAAATATAVMSFCLTSVTLGSGGVGYGSTAAPIWESSLGLVANNINNAQVVPRAARGTTTVVGGAVTAFTIEDQGFGFQKVPQIAVINTAAIPTGQATGTAVVGGINDTSILQPRVQ